MKNIYIDTRHSTAESKGTSDCKINLPSNNKYFITQHSILLILQFLYVGIQLKLTKNDTIYVRINGTDYAPSKCTIPEGNSNTITLGTALCKTMIDNYPFPGPTGGTTPTRCVSTANLANNTSIISNANDTFEILTDAQVVAFMYMGLYPAKVPTFSVNDMLQNTVMQMIKADGAIQIVTKAVLSKIWSSRYVSHHPIRNLYLISNTLGTHNAMYINGERGILKKIPVSADYNQFIYDQTVLGMDYLDCSNQKVSLNDNKLNDHSGDVVNLHGCHVCISIIFVQVADES